MSSLQTGSARTKKYTAAQAFEKISHYCAYQERSHREVRNKLYTYGLFKNEVEDLLTRLITDGFLNEERFAKAFAGGKFRIKHWGRNKIVHELEAHALTPKCIQKGLQEIDNAQYELTLKELLRKKWTQSSETNQFKKRDKAARHAIGKGFEPELVWRIVKEITVA